MTDSQIDIDIYAEKTPGDSGGAKRNGSAKRVLIEEPNQDVRELLALRCRRLGLSPLIHESNGNGHLPEVELIVVEPGSPDAEHLLRTHRTVRSTIPIICVSIYPRASGSRHSAIVAHLVKPCPWKLFDSAVWRALENGSHAHRAPQSGSNQG